MSETPTARDLIQQTEDRPGCGVTDAGLLASRVEAVLALHIEWWGYDTAEGEQSRCHECEKPWPCPTRRALEGEK